MAFNHIVLYIIFSSSSFHLVKQFILSFQIQFILVSRSIPPVSLSTIIIYCSLHDDCNDSTTLLVFISVVLLFYQSDKYSSTFSRLILCFSVHFSIIPTFFYYNIFCHRVLSFLLLLFYRFLFLFFLLLIFSYYYFVYIIASYCCSLVVF